MVAKAGGYLGPPFNGYCGVNEGYTLYPMNFNMVVYSLISHWVTVVVLADARTVVLRGTIWGLAGFPIQIKD